VGSQTREHHDLDVHLIELDGEAVVPLCNVPWPLDAESLEGRGLIAGRPVECLTVQTQVTMHRGYELPDAHTCPYSNVHNELERTLLARGGARVDPVLHV